MTPLPEPKPALLLAAHGTRDQAGVDAFAALAGRVGQLAAADGIRVAGGFIELSAPALGEAQGAARRSRSGPGDGSARGPGPRGCRPWRARPRTA